MQARNQLIVGAAVVACSLFIGAAGVWSMSGMRRAVPTVAPAPTALPVRTARPTPTSVPPPEPTPTLEEATPVPAPTVQIIVRAPTLAPKPRSTPGNAMNAPGNRIDYSEQTLRGEDFSGQALAGAYFIKADLRGASFAKADISGGSFYSANLAGANFRGANLEGADLTYSNLAGADLTDARLSRAMLEGASLDGAIIEGTILVGSKGRATAAPQAIPPTPVPPTPGRPADGPITSCRTPGGFIVIRDPNDPIRNFCIEDVEPTPVAGVRVVPVVAPTAVATVGTPKGPYTFGRFTTGPASQMGTQIVMSVGVECTNNTNEFAHLGLTLGIYNSSKVQIAETVTFSSIPKNTSAVITFSLVIIDQQFMEGKPLSSLTYQITGIQKIP
jgi:Pentapeptide repeats (8 copies)